MMEQDNVALQLYDLYLSNQELKRAVEGTNELQNIVNALDIATEDLSNGHLLSKTKAIISESVTNIQEIKKKTEITIEIIKENASGAKELFDYFESLEGNEIDEIEFNETLSSYDNLLKEQDILFDTIAYYDSYIKENNEKLAELHNKIDTLQTNINDLDKQLAMVEIDEDTYNTKKADLIAQSTALEEEYNTKLQDLILIKQLRDFTFESAYNMYTQYADFEENINTWKKTYEDGSIPTYCKGALASEIYLEYASFDLPEAIKDVIFDAKCYEYKTDILPYLTQDEKDIITYLYNTGNQEKALAYVKYMQNKAAQRHGEELANEITTVIDGIYKNVGEKALYTETSAFEATMGVLAGVGLVDGVKNFFEGLDNLLDADGMKSAEEYKVQYLIEYLRNKYEDEKFLQTLSTGSYEISSSIGNMIPSVLVSSIPGYNWVGLTMMGLSAAGNSREQALQQGLSEGRAWLYGTLSGLSEAGLEYALGGITKLAGGGGSEILTNVFGLPKLFSEMLSEGTEESLQSLLDPLLLTIASGGEIPYEVDWNEVLKSGIYGIVTAGIMNGTGTCVELVINDITYSITAEQAEIIKEQFKDVDLTKTETRESLENQLKQMGRDQIANIGIDVNSESVEILLSEDIFLKYDELSIQLAAFENIDYVKHPEMREKFREFIEANSDSVVSKKILYGKKGNWLRVGVDQGAVRTVLNSGNQAQINTLIEQVKGNYPGMTDAQAMTFLESIQTSNGICNYATVANSIFIYFEGDPEGFKNTFGFDMYVDGKINDAQLLADMYSIVNEGILIKQDTNTGEYNVSETNAGYLRLTGFNNNTPGFNLDAINKYLTAKNIETLSFENISLEIDDGFSRDHSSEYISTVLSTIGENTANGIRYSITYDIDELTTTNALDGTKFKASGEGTHIVTILGVDGTNLIVDNAGVMQYIDLSLPENQNVLYTIYGLKISETGQ